MGLVRENKKRETRQRISDIATELFFERGFDAVTVDEIATAAGVSKMTVFNYFARKEELLLDREDDLRLRPFCEAITSRPEGQSPIDALRELVRKLSEEKHPLCQVSRVMIDWWRVVEVSPALKSRLRELGDEAAEALAHALAGSTADGQTRLAAGLIVLTVRTAREEAIGLLKRGVSAKRANSDFSALVGRGLLAAEALLADGAQDCALPRHRSGEISGASKDHMRGSS